MTHKVDFSIIIVNYNTSDFVRDCLSSIYQSRGKATKEIILVDNNSTDGSVEMIGDQFKQVQVIANEENLGFGKACNQGIRSSKGKYILLLNSDTEIFPDTLDKVKNFLDNERTDPKIGIIGCRVLNKDGSLQYSAGKFPTLWSTFIDMFKPLHKRKYYISGYDEPHEVDWATGAFLLLDRQVIEDVGLFDEEFFMYYEEVDWCLRAKRMGWKVFYYPFASIVHKTPIAVKKHNVSEKVAAEIRRSHLYYFRKNHNYLNFIMLSAATLAYLLVKLFVISVNSFIKRDAGIEKQRKIRSLLSIVWRMFLDLSKKEVAIRERL